MIGFFKQFGKIKRLRIARNRKVQFFFSCLLWRGVNWRYKPLNWTEIARKQHNK
ncbi:hypothetical protein BHE74_00017010, partial [Ensete ventricosum]